MTDTAQPAPPAAEPTVVSTPDALAAAAEAFKQADEGSGIPSPG